LAGYTLHCFAQSGNAYKPALALHLAGRRYVVGDRLTIADLSLCGYLYWPEEIGVDWNVYPSLRDWLERIRAAPRWVHPYELMPGHPRPVAT